MLFIFCSLLSYEANRRRVDIKSSKDTTKDLFTLRIHGILISDSQSHSNELCENHWDTPKSFIQSDIISIYCRYFIRHIFFRIWFWVLISIISMDLCRFHKLLFIPFVLLDWLIELTLKETLSLKITIWHRCQRQIIMLNFC